MSDDQNRAHARDRSEPSPESEPEASPRWPEVDGDLDRALAVVRFLRERCPWDASRTPLSLIPHLQEEAHEVSDAIRSGDARALEGELGDLLLNLAFQVVLGEEEGAFDAASVAERLEEKMERRHPHLFGLGEKEEWERMKAREREGVLDGLPPGLEPLLRAHRIQDRVSGVGFDWSEPMGAWEKVGEELEEVREALERIREVRDGVTRDTPEDEVGVGDVPDVTRDAPDEASRTGLEGELEEELGDLLFAVVNLIRLAGAHASTVLHRANEKFARRFERLESLARERGIDVGEASLESLDALWDELKDEEDGEG